MTISLVLSTVYTPDIPKNEEYDKPYISFYSYITSPVCAPCILVTLVGLYLCIKNVSENHMMTALWHLTNMTWFSFGCDVLSGYFRVMPNLSNFYLAMEPNHLKKDKRFTLHTVYLSELFIYVPLSFICLYFYISNNPKVIILETFLAGIQLMGTICYYFPEILNKCKSWKFNKLSSALGFIFGIIWIIFPVIILNKNLSLF